MRLTHLASISLSRAAICRSHAHWPFQIIINTIPEVNLIVVCDVARNRPFHTRLSTDSPRDNPMSPYQSDHDHGYGVYYGRGLLRALVPRLVGTLTVKLAMNRPLTFEPTNDVLMKSIHGHTTRHILVVATLKHLSQTCVGWIKMIYVYHVIFNFEVNKDSVIIQRDDDLGFYMILVTVPSVLS